WRRPLRPVYYVNVSVGDPVQPINLLLDRDGDPGVLADRLVEGTVKAMGQPNTDQTPRLEKWLRASYRLISEKNVSVAELELLLDYYAKDVRRFLTAGTTVESDWRELNEAETPTQFDDRVGSAKNRLQRFYSAHGVRRFLALTDPGTNLDLLNF